MILPLTINFAAWWVIPSIISIITGIWYTYQHFTRNDWDIMFIWMLMAPILILNCLAWIIGAICK